MTKTLKPAGLLVAFLLTGCLGGGSTPTATTAPANSQTTPPPAAAASDPFRGTYNGVLPCADCDGLQTSLTLDGAGNYTIQSTKLGNKPEDHTASGLYRYTTDKKHLQLDNNASNLTFMVGDSFLEVRLPDGSKGERKLPDDNYRLKRQ